MPAIPIPSHPISSHPIALYSIPLDTIQFHHVSNTTTTLLIPSHPCSMSVTQFHSFPCISLSNPFKSYMNSPYSQTHCRMCRATLKARHFGAYEICRQLPGMSRHGGSGSRASTVATVHKHILHACKMNDCDIFQMSVSMTRC